MRCRPVERERRTSVARDLLSRRRKSQRTAQRSTLLVLEPFAFLSDFLRPTREPDKLTSSRPVTGLSKAPVFAFLAVRIPKAFECRCSLKVLRQIGNGTGDDRRQLIAGQPGSQDQHDEPAKQEIRSRRFN